MLHNNFKASIFRDFDNAYNFSRRMYYELMQNLEKDLEE